MTKEQYERWKDFSRRMVTVAVSARKKSPSRKDVLANIDFFFECRMDPDDEWKRVRNWDHTESAGSEIAWCCGSHISDLYDVFIPDYWRLKGDAAFEKAERRHVDPVSCCVRAGLDVAVSPSMGVAGFTAGDIRKMYPEGVPDWVRDYFKPPYELSEIHATNIGGIYAPGKTVTETRVFDQLPDSEGVWL